LKTQNTKFFHKCFKETARERPHHPKIDLFFNFKFKID
jgi:hypothetical protein